MRRREFIALLGAITAIRSFDSRAERLWSTDARTRPRVRRAKQAATFSASSNDPDRAVCRTYSGECLVILSFAQDAARGTNTFNISYQQADPIAVRSLPFVFESFTLVGAIDFDASKGIGW